MKREFGDINAFSAFLDEKAVQTRGALSETIQVSTRLLYEHAHNLYGKHPPLAELAQATKDERARIPGISTDEPLFRTGALLRDQLEARVKRVERHGRNDVGEAATGSAEIINLYHETGYRNARTGRMVPARPVFLYTAKEAGPQIAELFSAEVRRVFEG